MTPEQILESQQKLGGIIEDESQLDLSKLEKDFAFVTGAAGTGKTFSIRAMAEQNPNYMELCSTTGIAAVNLGGITINSCLKYFDTTSLENNFRDGFLHYRLREVRAKKRVLGIEECSMMPAEQLDLIVEAVDEINNDKTDRKLGVHLIGDLLQLPPVSTPYSKASPIYESEYWPRFQNNTLKLEKIWRQNNPEFVRGINLIRANKGVEGIKVLKSCGVRFENKVDNHFKGTTLIAKNVDVDIFNDKRLQELATPLIRTTIKCGGIQASEWKKNIPFELKTKIGAYVMVLTNCLPNFDYVNGDCGYIEDYDNVKESFRIKLVRTGQVVNIGRLSRMNLSDTKPDDGTTGRFEPYSDFKTSRWIIGYIQYHPIRLAWASSIHKAQGLSLDAVQIDTKSQFFGFESMGYVAISRCRTPAGLILVGDPDMIGKKIRMNPKVLKYV